LAGLDPLVSHRVGIVPREGGRSCDATNDRPRSLALLPVGRRSTRPARCGSGEASGLRSGIKETPITPEELVRQLRAFREQIPDFTLMPPAETRPLVRAANVTIAFVHACINAIAALPALASALGITAEALRAETEMLDRWSQVVDEMNALLQGLMISIRIRRHRVGGTALRTYQVSRHLSRYRENETLLPHIEAMKRASKFSRRRTATTPEPTEPVAKTAGA
jgi:hypothetical protein